MLDSQLAECGIDTGLTGIYNAARIYNMIEKSGNENIRTLFASTGVKGDDLPPYYYMRELLAPHSVNTAPLATIESWLKVKPTPAKLPMDDTVINGYFTKLADNGFDMDEVYATLLKEGLSAFEQAFQEMLESLR
jgi:transaldolase